MPRLLTTCISMWLMALVIGLTGCGLHAVTPLVKEPPQRSAVSPYGYFQRVGDLNIPRSGHKATLLPNGKVLIAEGRTFSKQPEPVEEIELYDPATRKFELAGRFTEPHSYEAPGNGFLYYSTQGNGLLLPNGKVFFVGYPSKHAELYDYKTGKFELSGEVKYNRLGAAIALLKDGRVMIMGGDEVVPNINHIKPNALHSPSFCVNVECSLIEQPVKIIEFYDYKTGKFVDGPEDPQLRYGFKPIVLTDGKLLMGQETYDPIKNTFSFTKNKHKNHSPYGQLLPDGHVFFHTTGDPLGNEPDEWFVPEKNSFFTGKTPEVSRFFAGSTLFNHSYILYTGGMKPGFCRGQSCYYGYSELFDFSKNSFISLPDCMLRGTPTAVIPLKNKSILVLNGKRNALFIPSKLLLENHKGDS